LPELFDEKETINPLVADVKFWGNWVLKEAKKEIGRFYPEEPDGSVPVGYIWARTVPCQNPGCGAEIPLMRQYWLAKKANKKVSLFPFVKDSSVAFRIVGDGYDSWPEGFKPENGSVARAVAACPVCGSAIAANTTRKLFQEGKSGQRMVAVVTHKKGTMGKKYRIATEEDRAVFAQAEAYLQEKREKLMMEWGMDPVPDEMLPPKGTLGFRIQGYGLKTWGDLFNSRQKLALIIVTAKTRWLFDNILKSKSNEDYAKAICSYLSIILSRNSSYNSSLAWWEVTGERTFNTFGRQALPMVFDFSEQNPFGISTGNLNSQIEINVQILDTLSSKYFQNYAKIVNESATSLKIQKESLDAVFTDPPYYDNVPYSYLSDFFYIWLKRSLSNVYPELFSTPLTPKKNEIVAYSNGPGGWEQGKAFFEEMLKKSFQEIHRVLKTNGIAVIVYAHKSTEGWETLINSLLDSGLIVTGAWPLSTEMESRLRASESAALASSIYIVARKMDRQPTGFYNPVKEELSQYLAQKLENLWQEGISGSDFFIAGIGSAIEVFGKYEKVMDYEGNIIRAARLLEDVRKIVTDFAVKQILHNGFSGEISDLTRFYILWRWHFGTAKVAFDEARKMAQSCSIDLSQHWNKPGFIVKEKEFIRVSGPQERKPENLKQPSELMDVLHKTLLLWEKSQRQEMMQILQESGFGSTEAFFRVAQAVSECLRNEDKEKKLLDGFLAGRERINAELRKTEQEASADGAQIALEI